MNLTFINFETWCDRNGFDRLAACPWCHGEQYPFDDETCELEACQLCGGLGWDGAVEAWDIYRRECDRARAWLAGKAVVGSPVASVAIAGPTGGPARRGGARVSLPLL